MTFVINGPTLAISINGCIRLSPNTDAGYRKMAAAWINGRKQ